MESPGTSVPEGRQRTVLTDGHYFILDLVSLALPHSSYGPSPKKREGLHARAGGQRFAATDHMSINKPSFLILPLFLLALLGSAEQARAQGFIVPFAGYNFGGDAQCPEITDCDDKRLNAGIALGRMGAIFGFEEEFAYTSDFFGSAPGLSSSVLTVMSSMMITPQLRPIRPYFALGVGLIRTNVELNAASLLGGGQNNFGWNIGGGVIIGSKHIGLRGDIRFIHAFDDFELLGIPLSDTDLDFGRASLGLYLGW